MTNALTHFGSPSVAEQIAADLGPDVCKDPTVRKTILWAVHRRLHCQQLTFTFCPELAAWKCRFHGLAVA